ncbi:THAP domain-containing protein 5-like [Ischnura elegans]|uniref:THAP domain-containing protein 5-like n=1 Tax=Ischnura elegans TaxID=197161 RepID=UPI001ED89A3C|nr:THAP domain-containing protein 5-like [Ischnura elegans]
MVNKCCVLHCRGNYAGGEKVSVFRFPEDDELKKKWIRRIPRENFIPTAYSRSESSAFDEKTGKVITVKLPTPRLKAGAVPSVFLGCPSYLSSASSSREEPETKRLRLEMKHLERCIKDSEEERRLSEEKVKFKDSCELHNKLGECDWLDWWKVVNVKTPRKGIRLKDPLQTPMTLDSEGRKVLEKVFDWVQRWDGTEVKERMLEEFDSDNLVTCLSRGGLFVPQEAAVNAVVHIYVVLNKIISSDLEEEFLK